MQGSGESVRSVAMIPNMQSDPDILRVGHLLADAARAAILPHFRQADLIADNKFQSGYDPVTEADRAAERADIGRAGVDQIAVEHHMAPALPTGAAMPP